MTPTATFLSAAALDGAVGLAALFAMSRSARRAGTDDRMAYLLSALGFLAGSVGIAISAGWTVATGLTNAALVPLGVGLAVQPVAVLAGALRCGGSLTPPGTVSRRCADGFVLATSVAYAVWSFGIGSTSMVYLSAPLTLAHKIFGLLLLVPPGVVVCVCVVIAWRVKRRGPGPIALAITLMTASSAILVISLGYHNVVLIAVGAVGHGVGMALASIGMVRGVGTATDPPAAATTAPGEARAKARRLRGTLLAWGPVALAIVACYSHLVIYHSVDNTSIVLATVLGAALALQQSLSLRDLQASRDVIALSKTHFERLAHTDPLTGLGNRRAFSDTLEKQVMRGDGPSVLLSIDLDGFKNINDLRGHDVGDAVLVEVARRLRANLRGDDIAARLGGDEFAVVLWLRHEEAVAAAGRLRAVLAAPYNVSGSSLFLSASIGLAPCEKATDVPTLIRNADLALRFAKSRGKNRVEGYAEAYAHWLQRRFMIESELRGAIARGELSLLYQPVVELRSGSTVGVEAVVHWRHPALGPIPRDEFIPIAEDANLIDEIGRWVMREACRQLSRWILDGHHVWLGINVSARELHRSDYVAQVTDFIRAHHLPADRLVLEVTEHAVAIDFEELATVLDALRKAGVRIALDDFGAGFSALAQLGRIPVDILKVNPAVIVASSGRPTSATDAGAGSEAGPLADVVVRLGESLGVDVIAAGIAEKGQRSVATSAGYDLLQGDLVACAMPAEHVEARLAAELIPAQRPAS